MDGKSGHDHTEIEWQFDAIDLRPVERWLRERGPEDGLSANGGDSRQIEDTYLDTDDWRIHRAGFVLRLRKQDGNIEATLKAHAPAVDGVRHRREITEYLEEGSAEALLAASGPVASRVRAVAGTHDLRALFTSRTTRRTFALRLGDDHAGELTLDETLIPVGSYNEPVRLNRVEVETDQDGLGRLDHFVDELVIACGLQPATVSKFGAAMIAHGLTVNTRNDFGSTKLDGSMTIADLAFAVLRRHFTAFLEHEPGSRLGDDPEELHDMRVAARRLRAAMSLFADFLPVTAQRMRDELRWVASALGDVRDIDVQREQLLGWQDEAQPEDRESLSRMDDLLLARRDRARTCMLDVLDSRRYERFIATFSTMLRRGNAKRTGSALEPALAIAPGLIGKRYRRFRQAGDQINPKSPPEEYHALRIQGKRLRYALEFFLPVYGKSVQAMIAPLVALQDLLGDHQDAEVAISQLREMSVGEDERLPGSTIFVMGKIAGRYEREAADCRTRFPKAYKSLRGKRWKQLKRLMEDRRPYAPDAVTQLAAGAPDLTRGAVQRQSN